MISGEDFLVSARSRALSKRRTGLCYRARNTLTPEYKYEGVGEGLANVAHRISMSVAAKNSPDLPLPPGTRVLVPCVPYECACTALHSIARKLVSTGQPER